MIYAILGHHGMSKMEHLIHVLQELGGWTSVEMVRRYAHLGPNHLADYCENSKKIH